MSVTEFEHVLLSSKLVAEASSFSLIKHSQSIQNGLRTQHKIESLIDIKTLLVMSTSPVLPRTYHETNQQNRLGFMNRCTEYCRGDPCLGMCRVCRPDIPLSSTP
jgi:hypothetical protein